MCEPIVEEIKFHVEMRPYGWAVLFDEVITMHKGDSLVMEGLLLSNGKPEYESVCIRRGSKAMPTGIRTKPEPHCPICGAKKMILKKPKPNQTWGPFWGCSQYPDCRGTRNIGDDGKPEED